MFLCCHAEQESQSEFHCVHLAQQDPALQPGGFALEKLLPIKGARLACFCLQVLCCRIEVRLVCHLHASHPAVPSTTELLLSWVCVPSDLFQHSHTGSDGVQAGVPKPSFNFVRDLKSHAAHHLVFNYFFPQTCQAPSLKQINFFALGKQSLPESGCPNDWESSSCLHLVVAGVCGFVLLPKNLK